MRHILLVLAVLTLFPSCRQDETHTSRELRQLLHSANPQYPYQGEVVFKELSSGEIEVAVELHGQRGREPYYFPAHLHYGAYERPDAPMAALLNPVDMRTLKSTTVISELADGQKLLFEDLENFDGHVKIHLALDGPDYHVILAAGNIGRNADGNDFNTEKIAVCAPY